MIIIIIENKIKKKGRQILEFCLKAEETTKYESDTDTNCNWSSSNYNQGSGEETGRTGDQKK